MSRILVLAATIFLAGINLAMADSPLQFDDPWSPVAPPGRTMAGFVTIHNHGDDDITLVDAASPQFGRIEIHTMTMDEGVMRMRRLEELVVASGRMVVLQPGGRHLMLFEPKETLKDGDTIDVELIDSDGNGHEVVLHVRPRD